MLTDLQDFQTIFCAGAGAMSGAINATAVSQSTAYEKAHVVVTDTSHGLKADSELFFAALLASSYDLNRMRHLSAVATDTMTIRAPEGYTAGTPGGTNEAWFAGYVNNDPYWFVGFKLHLSAADTSGETFSLDIDSSKSAYFDTKIFSKVMTGVTDIIYVPESPIPIHSKDILKFTWTNSGAKTWGLETMVIARV